MKRVVCLFIVVIFVWNVGVKQICASNFSFSFAITKKAVKRTIASQAIQFDSSDTFPTGHKKNNKKALKRFLFGITSEYLYTINNFEDESVLFAAIPSCMYTFSGNGKRGPPCSSYIF